MPKQILDEFQQKLEFHFRELSESRKLICQPVFALEHGLTIDEIKELENALITRLKQGYGVSRHWLPWIVYATERGYDYDGEEYWQSFEQKTPCWESKDRYKLSAWFRDFRDNYGGLTPTGTWAEHFSIIAWPITHAILPNYLQQILARSLYELRFSIASLSDLSPNAIGCELSSYTYSSKRFEEFLQQEELVGMIVYSLLTHKLSASESYVLPSTLERIINDLESTRRSREWLKEASRVVNDRFLGVSKGSDKNFTEIKSNKPIHERPNIKPKILLRYSADNSWSVLIAFQDFRTVTNKSEVITFLKTTRCRINGLKDVRPSGWFLSGNRVAVINDWPDTNKPLVKFEKENGVLEHLIESDCRLETSGLYAFKIGQDGIGREVLSRIVRPGETYVIISQKELLGLSDIMDNCIVACGGIFAYKIKVPEILRDNEIELLRTMGLQVALTVEIHPCGIPAIMWDGDGNSNWLTTDVPCFCVSSDQNVETIKISLNNNEPEIIHCNLAVGPVYFKLNKLVAGEHILRVDVTKTRVGDDKKAPVIGGLVSINVRKPDAFDPNLLDFNGIVYTCEPFDASLDQLWDGTAEIRIVGPESRRVTPSISLEKQNGSVFFSSIISEPLEMPVTPRLWRKKFEAYQARENCIWKHLEAASATLRLECEDLGSYSIKFSRDISPVRWLVSDVNGGKKVSVSDDTDDEDTPLYASCIKLTFPTNEEQIPISVLNEGLLVKPPGGLFIVKKGNYKDEILVSTGLSASGLGGLGLSVNYGADQAILDNIGDAIKLLKIWRVARLAGPLAIYRRDTIVDEFRAKIIRSICGTQWSVLEKDFLKNPDAEMNLVRLQQCVSNNQGFAAVLRRDANRWSVRSKDFHKWFSDLSKRYGVCKDSQVIEIAVALASNPELLARFYGQKTERIIKEIEADPAILRGARLMYLCKKHHKYYQNENAELSVST